MFSRPQSRSRIIIFDCSVRRSGVSGAGKQKEVVKSRHGSRHAQLALANEDLQKSISVFNLSPH